MNSIIIRVTSVVLACFFDFSFSTREKYVWV